MENKIQSLYTMFGNMWEHTCWECGNKKISAWSIQCSSTVEQKFLERKHGVPMWEHTMFSNMGTWVPKRGHVGMLWTSKHGNAHSETCTWEHMFPMHSQLAHHHHIGSTSSTYRHGCHKCEAMSNSYNKCAPNLYHNLHICTYTLHPK